MDESPAPALMRQRKMQRIAKVFFALAVLAVALPVLMGLLGINLAVPMGLLVATLMVIGVITWTRSDPVYARVPRKRGTH